jgi:hypothetical protein
MQESLHQRMGRIAIAVLLMGAVVTGSRCQLGRGFRKRRAKAKVRLYEPAVGTLGAGVVSSVAQKGRASRLPVPFA